MKKLYVLLLAALFLLHRSAVAQFPTFTYTGSPQSWTVPCGVDTITVVAVGATGGQAGGSGFPSLGVTTPGKGGLVQANVAVTPGQVLTVYVGGKGGLGNELTGGAGGWNGGGHADPHAWSPSPLYSGGGGGGASDVRIGGTALTDRVLVASGGGGAGYNGTCVPGDQPGGDGGGLTGSTATTCVLTGYTVTDAFGGTQIAGGAGASLTSTPPLYTAGFSGVLGDGGGTALLPNDAGIAGGGGGGYYGGGGGCWMGGGGGSSYTSALVTSSITMLPAYNGTGDGKVTICLTKAGNIVGAAPLCSGQTLPLTATVCGGTWASSNTSVATVGSSTGIVTGISGGVAYITYTLASGCGPLTTVTSIKVIQSPLPIIGSNPLCVGATETLSDPTLGGVWSSSNTAAATVGVVSGMVTGIYPGVSTITYYNPTAGCFTTFTLNVDGIAGPTKVCYGSSITLVSSDGGGAWSSSSPSVAAVGTTGVVTGLSLGTATISYSSPVCPSSYTVTVNPVAPIVAPDSICEAGTAFFTNVVGGGFWSSNDPKIASVSSGPGLVTGIKPGIAIISYLLPTGCLSIHNTTVIALPAPITGTLHVCPTKTVTLMDTVAGGTWSSSNTTVATVGLTNGVVTGINSDTTNITYTIKPGCSVSALVIVNPIPMPITGRDTICPGITDTMHSASIGGLWATSTPSLDTIVDTNGILTSRLSGTAVLSYTLPTGCVRTRTIYIYPIPVPTVTYNWALNTLYTDPGYPHYQWYDSVTNLIPHATSPSLAVIYYEWYYVVITDTNGCKSSSAKYYREIDKLGVSNVNSGEIRIYPNPSSGILYISSPVKVRAVLSGVDGRIEMEVADAKELDISRLADAAYFISLYDNSGQLIAVRKIVKE
jgi:uncharacterized protein YjdB